jgi:hypothetical protein
MTYSLEVEREGEASDRSYDYKTSVGTTNALEVEREGDVSNVGCNYNEGRDDVLAGGGECDMLIQTIKRGLGRRTS